MKRPDIELDMKAIAGHTNTEGAPMGPDVKKGEEQESDGEAAKVLQQGPETATGDGDEGGDKALRECREAEGPPRPQSEGTKEEEGIVCPTVPRWKEIHQTVKERSGGESAAAHTLDRQATGAGTSQTTPNNWYANSRSVRRNDTPFGPKIHNRTHAVQGEHGTPLGLAIVERRRQETEANARYG